MTTKIHIHADYTAYADFIRSIPEHAYPVGRVYCNRRNVVESTNIGGKDFVVKRYQVPIWFNRIAYTFLRKDKAQRAYENAQALAKLGILTPAPVAYIVQKHWRVFHTAWFVSLHMPYTPLFDFHRSVTDEGERTRLWEGVAQFMLQAHTQGVYFRDNNGGNILVRREAEGFRFCIVDINRLRLGRVPTLDESMCSFDQLGLDIPTLMQAISYYAKARGFDLERCLHSLHRQREKRTKYLARKRSLQRLFHLK